MTRSSIMEERNREVVMKILRSVNRRGFKVGTAGYFAVLKQNTWFPASRLPIPFRYRLGQSTQTPAGDHTDTPQEIVPPRIAIPATQHRSLIRPAFAILLAIAITSAVLWWIMSSAPSNAY